MNIIKRTTDWGKIHLLEARLAWWRQKLKYRRQELAKWEITGQRAHHWQDIHNKKGEKKEAEINQKQIENARVYIRKWDVLVNEALAEVRKYEKAINALKPKPPPAPSGEGWSVPQTTWNPYRRKIANWIVRELVWAHEHGWNGVVNSGLRTYEEQKYLWELYIYHGGNVAAEPGKSNHEGYVYMRGAVDISDPENLNRILNNRPGHKLLWAETHGLSDWPHFSGTGH